MILAPIIGAGQDGSGPPDPHRTAREFGITSICIIVIAADVTNPQAPGATVKRYQHSALAAVAIVAQVLLELPGYRFRPASSLAWHAQDRYRWGLISVSRSNSLVALSLSSE